MYNCVSVFASLAVRGARRGERKGVGEERARVVRNEGIASSVGNSKACIREFWGTVAREFRIFSPDILEITGRSTKNCFVNVYINFPWINF